MGTWAEDNFANDGARDYLALLTARLVATISEVYADKSRLELDEDGESMFRGVVEIAQLNGPHGRYGLSVGNQRLEWQFLLCGDAHDHHAKRVDMVNPTALSTLAALLV